MPARRSYPSATRARSLFLLVCYSYSSATRARGVARYPFVAKYEHARYPYVAKYEHPPGTGTTRGATPGYPCVARARTRPCARARYCPYGGGGAAYGGVGGTGRWRRVVAVGAPADAPGLPGDLARSPAAARAA